MDVSELSPSRCVECGGQVPVGTGIPVILGLGEAGAWEPCEVPGLFRCWMCMKLLQERRLESNVDPDVAFRFLTQEYLPRVRQMFIRHPLPGVERDLRKGTNAASTIAVELINVGPMKQDGIEAVFIEGDDEGQGGEGCEHEVDPAAVLASVELTGPEFTYLCPHCPDRHPAEELFEARELFVGVQSDSKD